ncbi:RNA-binding domain-containing protein [Macrolepiota fuliginosa MF-IS2]|uniref:Multiple RNA-binding domain-containing protein 1 n=1 Tax=Macrolepiota fuliginosa MF-IS2 TaxID=1400762 RepID=A0A9P5XD42_9AGAR|nr:RNA-binding domain-containing protein [Macrolepiota fuliginosa MF-IS2]
MSRLMIKNLPAYVTPVRLRQHFEQKGCPPGTLTDVKVAFKPDGTSRRFGFVGYKSDQEAAAARGWFDKTFIDSTRINVTLVDGSKDAPAPRPNKRPRLGPSPTEVEADHNRSETRPKSEKLPMKEKSSAQVEEFLEVMQPRTKKGPSWVNETRVEQPVPPSEEPKDESSAISTALSDMEWMKQRMSQHVDKEGKAFEQSDEEDGEEVNPVRETILRTRRLFLRNLAFSCTEADLTELFQTYGELSQVHIPLDSQSKQSKGMAYVTFASGADAFSAYVALDKKSFQGRLLHILPAQDRHGSYQVEEGEGRKKTVKEEKQAKRKAIAGKSFNWSMLYMNSDAVASSIADRMSINKSEILNPENGDNPAVKLALAETHIIQETKAYLESQGVLLSSFSTRARSDTTILVKNIPYGTTLEQIRELFEPHGQLSRVLVPPAGTMAVVEFERPDQTSKAFKAVAYRRLGNTIIYLEKGPIGMFTGEPTQTTSSASSLPVVKLPEQESAAAEEEASITDGTTLYVKNLSFVTTPERLTQVFRYLPSFTFARIQTKPDPKNPNGPRLSMGYGFVGFKDSESAKGALKSMQGFVLDGHSLHVKFAGRGAEDDSKDNNGTNSKSRTTKIIVKNVPFEATKKDIRDLFGAHGHLKSVRLPKKFDSRTRGFAFLEFVSRHEAENAYNALRHTHLLGRHLVLEWAEEAEQDLDVLRQKAGVGFGGGKAMPGRKRKLELGKKDDEDPVALAE